MVDRRILVVLGMHRSGTSMLTRGLQALSVDLGDNLMAPVKDNNEKGFWEDLDFNRFNERLLEKAGSAWQHLAPVDQAKFLGPEYAAERIEATALVERKLANADVFAFKDPRTAIVLPFWRCILEDLEIDGQYIITVRNPLEVARSLQRRDGFDLTKGLMLWAKHMHGALSNTRDKSRLFVHFDALFEDPEAQLRRIADAFELRMPGHNSRAFQEYTQEFLDPEMRHNRISARELGRTGELPPEIIGLYEVLTAWTCLAPGEVVTFDAEHWNAIEAYLEHSAPLFSYADRVEETVVSLKKQVKATEAQIRKLEENAAEQATKLQELGELRQRHSDLSSQFAAIKAENELLNSGLADAQTEHELLNSRFIDAAERHSTEHTRLAETIHTLSGQVEDNERLLLDLRQALKVSEQQLAAATAALKVKTDQATNSEKLLTEANEKLSALQADLVLKEDQLSTATASLHDKTDQATNSEKLLAEANEKLSALQADLVLKESHLAAAKSSARESEIAHRRVSEAAKAERQERDTKIARLHRVVAELNESFAAQRTDLRLTRSEMLAVKSSTSWRLTRPIRGLKLLLTQPVLTLRTLKGRWTRNGEG